MVECNCCLGHGDHDYHCETDPTFPEARALGWRIGEGDDPIDICPSCIDCEEKD